MTLNRRGFTLVELLVVVGMIAVLMGAMTSAVAQAREGTDDALFDDGVRRLGADRVVKADAFAVELDACPARASGMMNDER